MGEHKIPLSEKKESKILAAGTDRKMIDVLNLLERNLRVLSVGAGVFDSACVVDVERRTKTDTRKATFFFGS